MSAALAALAVGAGLGAVGGGISAASKIDRLSPEQRNKLKELERNQALGMLGLDEAQQQRILNQQLQPVQAAEREAFNRQAQQMQIADVGQGATFRGQQALQQAAAQSRSEAIQRGQRQIAEQDAIEEAKQLRELAQIRAQRQQNIAAVGEIGQVVGDAALKAVGIKMQMDKQTAYEKMLENAYKDGSKLGTGETSEDEKLLKFLVDEYGNNPDPVEQDGLFPAGGTMPTTQSPPPQSINTSLDTEKVYETLTTAELVDKAAAGDWRAQGELDFRTNPFPTLPPSNVDPAVQQLMNAQQTVSGGKFPVGTDINLGGVGATSYGYVVTANDPITGLPSAVEWYSGGQPSGKTFNTADANWSKIMDDITSVKGAM
jgi:hypothetical protein